MNDEHRHERAVSPGAAPGAAASAGDENDASVAVVGAVERVLRSPWRLAIVVAAFVAVLSWLGVDQQRRALESRIPDGFGEVDLASLFVPEFAHNLLWALLAPLLLGQFVALWRRLHPIVFAAAQLVLCLACAWGMGFAEHHLSRELRDWIGPPVVESEDAPSFDELERLARERRRADRAERERRQSNGGGEGPGGPVGPGDPPSARRTEPNAGDEPLPPRDFAPDGGNERELERDVERAPDRGPTRPDDDSGARRRFGPPPWSQAPNRDPRDAFDPPIPGEVDDEADRGPRGRRDRMRAFGLAPTAADSASRRLPREVLLYLMALGLSGSAFAFLAQRDAERRQLVLELEAATLSTELSRAKLRTLRAQLQPHFLFNALHGIGGLVRAQRGDEALRTLADLGTLLRRTLDSDRADRWPLADELELIDEYLSIEAVRLGERLTVERDIDRAVVGEDIPPLLLLPIVENAIRHGIANVVGSGVLRIEVARAGDQLRLVVEDSGPGFPDDVLALRRHPSEDEVHVGLFNTRERLERLFPGAHRFDLSNVEGGGARVTIELPASPDQS